MRRSAVVGLVLVVACHGDVVESPAKPVAEATTRVQVRVLTCLPVGHGMACRGEVEVPGQGAVGARLEACVGSGDDIGLAAWLEARFHGELPVSVWMDVAAAPPSARYCGILIDDAGGHWRVVDFAGAGPR